MWIGWTFSELKSVWTKCDHRISSQKCWNTCFAWILTCILNLNGKNDLFLYELNESKCAFEEFLSHDYRPQLGQWLFSEVKFPFQIRRVAEMHTFNYACLKYLSRSDRYANKLLVWKCGWVEDIIKILNVPICHAFRFVKHSCYYFKIEAWMASILNQTAGTTYYCTQRELIGMRWTECQWMLLLKY